VARAYLILSKFPGRSVSVNSSVIDVHPSIQPSAEVRPNVRYSFGEPAYCNNRTFGSSLIQC